MSADPSADWHRAQGIEANNGCWEMIEAARTPANDEELLRRAYASAYHWQRAAGRTTHNEARAQWMLSKSHLLVGYADRALNYARECLATCEASGIADFDLAYAHDALARALRALGDHDGATRHAAAAQSVPVADPEDTAILDADLAVPL